MNLKLFLLSSCIVIGWTLASVDSIVVAQESNDVRPNILFIAVDDLRPELGCYGCGHAQSPNLDRFGTSAVTFTNHFVQVPTCGASRFALLTGRSPYNSRALGNNAFFGGKSKLTADSPNRAQTFPELFRANNYRTVCIGKISHTPDGRVYAYDGSGDGRHEMPNAWDELTTPFGDWQRGWGTFFAYHDGKHREDGQGHRDLMQFVAQSDDELPDGMMATHAIEQLAQLKEHRSESGQPFLMGLGFYKPHLPWVATEADWNAFDGVEIPVAEHAEKIDAIGWHRSGEFYGYHVDFEKSRPLATADQRKAKRAYLACVRYVDRQIGRVLDSLDEHGLSDNTIVVVWGDHGWHLGETAIWGKHSPFDRSLQSVMMIRAPGVSQAGHRCDELVESIDIYPTLIDLCQPEHSETAHPLDGHSLRSLLEGGSQPLRNVSLSFFSKGFSARTLTHRFVSGEPLGSLNDANLNDANLKQGSKFQLFDLSDSLDPLVDVKNTQPETVETLLGQLKKIASEKSNDH